MSNCFSGVRGWYWIKVFVPRDETCANICERFLARYWSLSLSLIWLGSIKASSTLTDSESDSDQMSPTPVYASFIRNDFKEDESYSAFAREQLVS